MTAIYHSKYQINKYIGKLSIEHFLVTDSLEPEEKRRPERRGSEQKVISILG